MSLAVSQQQDGRSRRQARRRAPWRQWLIEAERGLTAAFRSDSIFFVHLFAGSLAIAAAGMLGLSAAQWGVLVLALCLTISAELFHQVLKQLGDLIEQAGPKRARTVRRFGVAGVAVATLGSGLAIGTLLLSRLWALFAA